MRGALITVEGTEGVGKSTILGYAADVLQKHGIEILRTREPGGTRLGERIREVILHSRPGSMSADTETLLMYAARSHHLDRVIRPAIERGVWVLCDRFVDATYAYQAGGREGNRELLAQLEFAILDGLKPDLTILLDAPLDVGFSRIKDRELDHFELEGRDFFARVRDEYLQVAAREPGRVKVIDAAQTQDDVEANVGDVLATFLAQFDGGED